MNVKQVRKTEIDKQANRYTNVQKQSYIKCVVNLFL